MLSSEFTVVDNPLENEEAVKGVYLLNRNLYIYGHASWVRYDMRGNKEDNWCTAVDTTEWPILCKFSSATLSSKLKFVCSNGIY